MYKKTPKTKKTAAVIFSMVLTALGIYAVMIGGVRAVPLPLLAQFFGVVFIITGIYIVSTKVCKEMIYAVIPTEREVSEEELASCGPKAKYDFIVAQHKGFRDIVNVRVGFDEVTEAVEINRTNRAQYRQKDKKKKRYSYDTQFAPARQLRVQVNDDIVLFLTYDEELLKVLNKKIK